MVREQDLDSTLRRRRGRKTSAEVGLPGVEQARVNTAKSGDQLVIRSIERRRGKTVIDQLNNLLYEEHLDEGYSVDPQSIDKDHFPLGCEDYYLLPESTVNQLLPKLQELGFDVEKDPRDTHVIAKYGNEKIAFIYSPESTEGETPEEAGQAEAA